MLAGILHNELSKHPSIPPILTIRHLGDHHPQLGKSMMNHLRQKLTGITPEDPKISSNGDKVYEHIAGIAAESYWEFLIEDRQGSEFRGSLLSPHSRSLLSAIAQDPSIPFDSTEFGAPGINLKRSTGSLSGFHASFFASSILSAAWDHARLSSETPTLSDLIENIEQILTQARQLFSGKEVNIVGLASLTGVSMPSNYFISTPWGRLRPARQVDHPPLAHTMAERTTTATLEDGTDVTISDAGDIIIEAHVAFRVSQYHGDLDSPEAISISSKTREELESRIMEVRLAHLLSSNEDPPVILPVWRRFIEPIQQGRQIAWSNPQHFAMRTPAQLTKENIDSWQEWIARLHSISLDKLGVAPGRILRASAERLAPDDSLVDTVVAWESLFGTDNEATLRVSASISRLLEPPGPERRSLRSRIAEIYSLRSRLVHGARVAPGDLFPASRDALNITLRVLRTLIVDRPDLISKSSGERSTEILMS